uniref:Very-long-chain 3-oxoacyl-CoA synthase n=1 Tax=viral metagenome TaxID=1070528 RepID=A0A6C0EJX8_9ZZZZ
MISIHLLSPVLYYCFVKCLNYLHPCPQSNYMIFFRKIHNIILCILSFIMLIGITVANYQTYKFNTLNNLLCVPYNNNIYATISVTLFLYSKYIEWGDTVYLHLSGKSISQLQYTHHMTTAFLVYCNMVDYISPGIYVCMSLNCFVHIWMYWYFAYPRGYLKKYKVLITQAQIVQHIVCLVAIIYTSFLDNCEQNKYGNSVGFLLYMMYLLYFSMFYFKNYIH